MAEAPFTSRCLPLMFLLLFLALVGLALGVAPVAPVAADGAPDLVIAKSAEPDPVSAGDSLTYTLTITNVGSGLATGTRVTDTLPVSVTFESASAGCTHDAGPGIVVCDVGELEVNAETTFTVVVTVDLSAGPSLVNTATVSADQVEPVPAVEETTVYHPGLAVRKYTATPVIRAGDTVAYTITVTNTGDVGLSGVTVTDEEVPACSREIGVLTVSDPITAYTCSAVNVTADVTNTVVVSGTPPVGPVVTASASASVDVINPAIVVSKLPDAQMLRSGDTALFTVIVTNTGDVRLTSVTRLDPLVPECGGIISSLAPGEYAVNYCSRANVKADFTNTITASGTPSLGPAVVSSDTAYVDVIGPAVVLDKSPASQMVRPGGTALFTITVTNSGDVDLGDITVTDPGFPACERTFAEPLLVGTNRWYTCTVGPVASSFTNLATVTVTPPDNTPITDTAAASVNLINPALAVAKLPASQTVRLGDTVTFTIRVTNTGDSALTGVTISDALAPDCTRAIGTLAPLQNSHYTCRGSAVTTSFTNVVTATGKPPTGADVTASATARVQMISPAIRISKEPDAQTVRAGDPVTFTIVVTNAGDVALADVSVSDVAAPTCARSIGPLAVAGSSRYTCTAQNVITSFTNVATATGSTAPGGVVTHTDSADVEVVAPAPTRRGVYLPVVLRTEPKTELYVTTDNTGGVSRLELWRTADNVRAHVCENLPDNTVGYPCGTFAPGSYRIEAYTVRCGQLTAQRTWGPGPVTIRVFCR